MSHRTFAEFLQDGTVKQQRINPARAQSLIIEAGKRRAFLLEMTTKIPLTEDNANYYIEQAYDTLMELIRAKLHAEGFKASGVGAHEAEVSYLRNLDFPEAEVRFMDELRKNRNGILYYGERQGTEYARQVLKFVERLYPKLRQLLKDLLP